MIRPESGKPSLRKARRSGHRAARPYATIDKECLIMCGNDCNSFWWIIILLLIFFMFCGCGCGNNNCGCGNNNGNCGCGC